MPDQYVSDEIRDFLLKNIDSVAQIEALILIRANSDARWNAAHIAARLYTSEAEAAEALDRLCAAGLLAFIDETYCFKGVSKEHTVLIQQLEAIYARHLIPVTNIVHAKPRRIRSFADAFRFRKGP